MKRWISLTLALLCLLSLCACGGGAAPAADPEPAAEAEEEVVEEVPATPEPVVMPPYEPLETKFGFRFEYPEEYQNLKGELAWWISSFSYRQAEAELYYVEVPEEEREAFREKVAVEMKDVSGWRPQWSMENKCVPIFSIEALMDDSDSIAYYETVTPAQFIQDYFGEIPEGGQRTTIPIYQSTLDLENEWTLIVQRDELYTFEGEAVGLDEPLWQFDDEHREEVRRLLDDPALFASGLKAAPWELPGQVGSKVSFETQTLQGDTITSEELLSGHKVTMVNIWATWCGPCVGEMPQLETLNARFAEKDCQIIGVCLDAARAEETEAALQVLEECGVTYTNVRSNSDMDWANVGTIPTSFFIGEDGTILLEPVVGAYVSAYPGLLDKALALVG